MSAQMTIDQAIAAGEQAMQACTDKAETLGFSTDAAKTFVLGWLAEYGPSWGESMVDAAKATGRADLIPHEDRAFGAVFSSLSRQHRIRCVEYGLRVKGNGTAGARRWSLVQ
jgi:hypothetical protein